MDGAGGRTEKKAEKRERGYVRRHDHDDIERGRGVIQLC